MVERPDDVRLKRTARYSQFKPNLTSSKKPYNLQVKIHPLWSQKTHSINLLRETYPRPQNKCIYNIQSTDSLKQKFYVNRIQIRWNPIPKIFFQFRSILTPHMWLQAVSKESNILIYGLWKTNFMTSSQCPGNPTSIVKCLFSDCLHTRVEDTQLCTYDTYI